MARARHFLWDAFMAMADSNAFTEAEARAKLKDSFPHLASAVDEILDADGDMAVAKEAAAKAQSAAISADIRSRYERARLAAVGSTGRGTLRQEAPADGSSNDRDFSSILREQIGSKRNIVG